MFDERLAEFSRERLDGREIPEDLRTILIGHWSGDEELVDLVPVEFLEAGAPHPLRDHDYLSEKERADPEMQCVMVASEQMAEFVQLVCEGGKGWIGYWVHPGQATDGPPLIELDTEAQYWSMDGTNFAEAVIAEAAGYEDDPEADYTDAADRLIARGVPISTRILDDLDGPGFNLDPQRLDQELIEAERVKRGLGGR